jgi:predicted DNA binding CopG/RHH family protein
MDAKVLEWLRKAATKKGMPYQSLINDILAERMKRAS